MIVIYIDRAEKALQNDTLISSVLVDNVKLQQEYYSITRIFSLFKGGRSKTRFLLYFDIRKTLGMLFKISVSHVTGVIKVEKACLETFRAQNSDYYYCSEASKCQFWLL